MPRFQNEPFGPILPIQAPRLFSNTDTIPHFLSFSRAGRWRRISEVPPCPKLLWSLPVLYCAFVVDEPPSYSGHESRDTCDDRAIKEGVRCRRVRRRSNEQIENDDQRAYPKSYTKFLHSNLHRFLDARTMHLRRGRVNVRGSTSDEAHRNI